MKLHNRKRKPFGLCFRTHHTPSGIKKQKQMLHIEKTQRGRTQEMAVEKGVNLATPFFR